MIIDELLKELRSFSPYTSPQRNYEFGNKVANEIERLQAEISALKTEVKVLKERNGDLYRKLNEKV